MRDNLWGTGWRTLSCFILVMAFAAPVSARTLKVPVPFATIASALEAALPGEVIQVACGTYGEHGLEMRSGVTLRSQSGDPSCVIVDGGGLGRILRCSGVSTTTRIEGITFRNGYTSGSNPPQWGGGILCISGAAPTIANCVFESNVASVASYYGRGGGLGCYQSSPSVEDCLFQSNLAEQGGGVVCDQSAPTFERCSFVDNAVPSQGGAMWADESSLTLSDCEVVGNVSQIYGGGIAFSRISQPLVDGCTFRENSGFYGGGISCTLGASPIIRNCLFEENHGWSDTSAGAGGGLFCGHSVTSPVVTDSQFLRNDAGSGGGAYATDFPTPRFERCLFAENSVTTNGAAVLCQDDADAAFLNCTFVHNASVYAGSALRSRDCSPVLDRCIFAWQTSGVVLWCTGYGAAQLTCCNLFGNAGGDFVACAEGQEGVNGNFSADPLFCDLGGGNYALDAMSPCLPGRHPDGADCGLIGAYGQACGVATSVGEAAREQASWGVVKFRFE